MIYRELIPLDLEVDFRAKLAMMTVRAVYFEDPANEVFGFWLVCPLIQTGEDLLGRVKIDAKKIFLVEPGETSPIVKAELEACLSKIFDELFPIIKNNVLRPIELERTCLNATPKTNPSVDRQA